MRRPNLNTLIQGRRFTKKLSKFQDSTSCNNFNDFMQNLTYKYAPYDNSEKGILYGESSDGSMFLFMIKDNMNLYFLSNESDDRTFHEQSYYIKGSDGSDVLGDFNKPVIYCHNYIPLVTNISKSEDLIVEQITWG